MFKNIINIDDLYQIHSIYNAETLKNVAVMLLDYLENLEYLFLNIEPEER